jgi:hypothetical protein
MNRSPAAPVAGSIAEEAVPVPGVSAGTRSRIVLIAVAVVVFAVILVVAVLVGGGGGGGVDPGGAY